ncbi:MAG: DUF4190 domain-containing protein [Tissierellia bacterium]|nr:DUF4190 domain-containing protein [Tissierellia bacterium]
MAIASLVLGIISLVIALFAAAPLGWLGAILGLIGVVLGAKGRKDIENRGMATAGLVCSIIGLILNLLFFIACAACLGGLGALSNMP